MSTCPLCGAPHSLSRCPRWKAGAVVLAALLTGCGTPSPKPVRGDMRVIDFECDDMGVKSVRIMATGYEIATISWDNVTVCGDPT